MKGTGKKMRLDALLVERGDVQSRERAKAMILAGKVRIAGQVVDKAGHMVLPDANVSVDVPDMPWASRGALKLLGALAHLPIEIDGMVCMDVGASTGGFTDVMLDRNAAKVFAIDVGYGQLAWKLQSDDRVVCLDRTNIRHLEEEKVGEKVDLVTIDTSFISLRLVVPACMKFLKAEARFLALIKPQFEVGKDQVGKGGVVRDPEQHRKVIAEITTFMEELGLFPGDAIPSPVKGPKGNQEFILPIWTTPELREAEAKK